MEPPTGIDHFSILWTSFKIWFFMYSIYLFGYDVFLTFFPTTMFGITILFGIACHFRVPPASEEVVREVFGEDVHVLMEAFEKEIGRTGPNGLVSLPFIPTTSRLALKATPPWVNPTSNGEASNSAQPYAMWIVGHRGAGLDAPENSLSAFRLCKSRGCTAIEFDVALTKDLVPVVFHDDTLTRIASINRRIQDMTYAELMEVDISVNHPLGHKFRQERIPTLQEAITTCLGLDLRFFIDIKDTDPMAPGPSFPSSSNNRARAQPDPGTSTKGATAKELLVRPFGLGRYRISTGQYRDKSYIGEGEYFNMVEIILEEYNKNHAMYSRAIVSSFNPMVIYHIRRRNPMIIGCMAYRPCFHRYETWNGDWEGLRFRHTLFLSDWIAIAKDAALEWGMMNLVWWFVGLSTILIHKDFICKEVTYRWFKKGVRVYAWTVNNPLEKLHLTQNFRVGHLTDTLDGSALVSSASTAAGGSDVAIIQPPPQAQVLVGVESQDLLNNAGSLYVSTAQILVPESESEAEIVGIGPEVVGTLSEMMGSVPEMVGTTPEPVQMPRPVSDPDYSNPTASPAPPSPPK